MAATKCLLTVGEQWLVQATCVCVDGLECTNFDIAGFPVIRESLEVVLCNPDDDREEWVLPVIGVCGASTGLFSVDLPTCGDPFYPEEGCGGTNYGEDSTDTVFHTLPDRSYDTWLYYDIEHSFNPTLPV